MTRKGPTKPATRAFGEGRLTLARAYLKAAREQAALADASTIGNPIVSQIVTSTIAYVDALTVRFSDRTNRQDHIAAVKLLRDVLGNRLPAAQQNRLRRLLAVKDLAQYGAGAMSKADAERFLRDIETFAAWAEAELARPPAG